MSRTEHRPHSRHAVFKALCALLVLALICAAAYWGGRRLEMSTYKGKEVRGDLSMHDEDLRLVTYGDRQYAYNERLTTVLFMGIDRGASRPGSTSGFRNGGQADFLMLVIIDPVNKTLTQLHIDRDTMAPITVLGVLGNEAGTKDAQICLSHGFGDGKAQSCAFTVNAVSKLLCGVDVDFYVAMDMDSIPILNDVVGGVTVTLEEDFTAFDPAMKLGEIVTLHGEQAEMFVRWRTDVGDGTNASRMRRQRAYMSAISDVLSKRIEDNANFVGHLYDEIGDHLLTNMSRGRMINEANRAVQYAQRPTLEIEGEHGIGIDGFMEFHADQAKLEKLVLDTFYLPHDR